MGFDDGRLILDNEAGVYYAGQTIHGKIVFDQDKIKTFRGLFVKVKGFCNVHWTTTHTRQTDGRSSTYTETHESNEEYFHSKIYLLGSESGEYTLQPGHHELAFQCHIPPNCPSSFEGSHGHIRYEVKAVVDRAFKLDQEKKCAIRVIAPLDLNVDPYCKEPIVMEFEETYCCWCMNSGSSDTLIKIPYSGFCPGQRIPIEISCDNHSSVKIDTIRFYLKREITFIAESNPDTRSEESTITECKQGPVPPNSKRNFKTDLEIPLIDTYNVNSCRFIDIETVLKVVIETDGCHEDGSGSRRIVIGTVPIVGFQDDIHKRQPQINVQQYPDNKPGYPITNQPYPNAQPFNNSYPQPQYPGNGYPNSNSPGYPNQTNPGFPYAPNPGYPNTNSPYPGAPNIAPYPVPFDGKISPYRGNSPVPVVKNPPTTFGFNVGHVGEHKDGANMPLLPMGAVPYPPSSPVNPFATASAPEPSTPDTDEKKAETEILVTPPFNPEFAKEQEKKAI